MDAASHPESAPPPKAVVAARAVLVAAILGAIFWTILQVAFFLRSNPVLWASMPGRPFGVFGELFAREWSFSLRHAPPVELLYAVFWAGLTTGLGALALGMLRVRVGRLAFLPMAFVLGATISGAVLELLGIAGVLERWAVALHWIALYAVAFVAWKHLRGRPEIAVPVRVAEEGRFDRGAAWAFAVLAGIAVLLAFWHALLYPETYWDSLILYLGYARMIHQEGGFPFRAVGQVGIGLGANYPHLYSTYGAAASALFGSWTDLPQRFAAPLAGLGTAMLVAATVRAATGRWFAASCAAMLYAGAPYVLVYHAAASNYSFALLFTAALCHGAFLFLKVPRWETLLLCGVVVAGAMRINYLMGVLGIVGIAAAAFLALEALRAGRGPVPPILRRWTTWAVVAGCIVFASPWYIRNAVMTGNPVYAFFAELFPATVRVNPEVMASAEIEWFRNGDGIGRLAEEYHDLLRGRPPRDQGAVDFERQAGVGDRIAASFAFWQGFDAFRVRESADGLSLSRPWIDRLEVLLRFGVPMPPPDGGFESWRGGEIRILHWRHAYKLTVLVWGFALPGALLGLLAVAARLAGARGVLDGDGARLLLVAGAGIAPFLFYHYFLGDFYLYQVIPLAVPAAYFAGMLLHGAGMLPGIGGIAARGAFAAVAVVAGIVGGVGFGLMGFKAPAAGPDLFAFRNAGMPGDDFMRLRFGDEVDMWRLINRELRGESILTHENRHYLFEMDIEFVHLDDWDVQQVWGAPLEERLDFLRRRGVRHYLRVPNEANHRVNARLGVDEMIEAGHLVLLREIGGNALYEFRFEESNG